MDKQDVIKLFGSRQVDSAKALGITRSAFNQWPEILDARRVDLVLGAAFRLGIEIPSDIRLNIFNSRHSFPIGNLDPDS